MRVYRHSWDLPPEARGAAVAIGNFDGVHMGHRAVIGEAGKLAHAASLPWAVLTFEPHPRELFNPDGPPFRLTPFREKAAAIAGLGVEILVVLRFDWKLCRCPAEDFVEQVLVDGLGAAHVVAGYDFHFGHQRRGDCAMLLDLGRKLGFDFTAVHAASDEGGDVYSSTRARACLEEGDVRGAAEVLGRPFAVDGRVRRGDERGRTIGFPTANLALGRLQRPKLGVYAVEVVRSGGEVLQGVANIGRRPTFGGEDEVLEVHLFDFEGYLYGERLEVRLIDFIRAEKKFDGIDALKAQIARDGARAREILGDVLKA